MASQPSLDQVFAALSDPTRRAILSRLVEGEASVSELAGPFSLSVRAVSKHISVLESAGLISKTPHAQKRLSRIEATPLRAIDNWLGEYRQLWERRFDRMEQYVKDEQERED